MRAIIIIGLSASLAACATAGGPETASAPDLTPVAGQPVSPTGRLVLACVREGLDTDRIDMISDDSESRLVRFTCEGATARRLFDILGPRSADIGSEWREGDVVYRSTERINANLYGSDFCKRDGDTYSCLFNLNLGGFIKD